MRISQRGINFLKSLEGVKTVVYLDAVGIRTCGVGHVCKLPVGTVVTMDQVNTWLVSDLICFEAAVNSSVKVSLTQDQFDALVVLAFNIGDGGFKKSSLVVAINAGHSEATIRAAWALWCKGGGKVLPGLVKRRQLEADRYFS